MLRNQREIGLALVNNRQSHGDMDSQLATISKKKKSEMVLESKPSNTCSAMELGVYFFKGQRSRLNFKLEDNMNWVWCNIYGAF